MPVVDKLSAWQHHRLLQAEEEMLHSKWWGNILSFTHQISDILHLCPFSQKELFQMVIIGQFFVYLSCNNTLNHVQVALW